MFGGLCLLLFMCLLLVDCWLFIVVRRVLLVGCCLLGVCLSCSLCWFIACFLDGVRCSLFVARCSLLFVGFRFLVVFVACCGLFVDRRLLLFG